MISLSDIPDSCFLFRADGSIALLVGGLSPEHILSAIMPGAEDAGILEEDVLPSGRKFVSSRLAELHAPENALVSSWLGRPAFGSIVVLPAS